MPKCALQCGHFRMRLDRGLFLAMMPTVGFLRGLASGAGAFFGLGRWRASQTCPSPTASHGEYGPAKTNKTLFSNVSEVFKRRTDMSRRVCLAIYRVLSRHRL
jgi:hypothetical protein